MSTRLLAAATGWLIISIGHTVHNTLLLPLFLSVLQTPEQNETKNIYNHILIIQ